MARRRIQDPKTKETFFMNEIEDFEYRNPLDWLKEATISSSLMLDENILLARGFALNPKLEIALQKRAEELYEKRLEVIRATPIPENLKILLVTKKKKDQEKLLRGLTITSEEFIAFLIYASEVYGFTLSQFKEEHLPPGYENHLLPSAANIEEDGSIAKIGHTTLTDGQIKTLINQRRVTVAKFIDNGETWHCFFHTYNSLGGKENYGGGTPHMHYISNAWTHQREYVVTQVKSRDYKLFSLPHIHYVR